MGCRCSKDSIKVENYKFFILHQIAEGGFGVIHLVEDKRHNVFALKEIKCSTKEDADKFALENSYYKRFNNTNIIRLFYDEIIVDPIHSTYRVLLVFPYYKNGTLFDEMEMHSKKNKYLPEEHIVKLMIGLCYALRDIHDSNLAHRDLKPQNILLDDDRTESILTDFGSMSERYIHITNSKKAQEIQDWANENCSMFYKAPELFSPQVNTKISEMADVWSFGCNLYASMYNKGPFDYVVEKGDSIALAVSSSRFSIPVTPKRSDILIKIIKGTLVVDETKRLKIDQIINELKKFGLTTDNC